MEEYQANGIEFNPQFQPQYEAPNAFENGQSGSEASENPAQSGAQNDGAAGSRAVQAHSDQNRDERPRTKRTRATGEALNILKREFEENPNPNAQNRKRISELTGLPEKNVRIWFQNRRAKHRKTDRITKPSAVEANGPGSSYLAADFDRIPIDINPNYCFIDVKSLTVGSWKRLKSGNLKADDLSTIKRLSNLSPISINEIMANATDLMVLISKKNHEINYFFSAIANNTKILFRIFFPIATVVDCSLTVAPESLQNEDSAADDAVRAENDKVCELRLSVSKAPTFAVYFSDGADQFSANQWSICEDFSEERQVSEAYTGGSNIPHVITGLGNSLNFMNSTIQDHNTGNSVLSHTSHAGSQTSVNVSDTQNLILHPEPQSLGPRQQPFFDDFNEHEELYGMGEQNTSQFAHSNANQTHPFTQHTAPAASNDHGSPQYTESGVPRTPDFLRSHAEMGNEEQSGLNNLLIFEDQNNNNTKNGQSYF
ncbi:LAQU0S04e07668g1_1 [Lachancea quebecensis]|uniref:LAQU0S04e07668g1_1 n=1 Tax=Lachancea quebecensis TaxID=1654605 RepID=A0A0P1KR14_9SACH|nr:LAQU0S04e07668g1_1 [Lachancea quebecensis]